jgi:ABC-type uncharacterized transport system permease subunit
MMHDVLAVLSIVLYGMSIIWLVVDVLNHKTSRFVIVPAWFAVMMHFMQLGSEFVVTGSLNFSFIHVVSLVSALVSLLLLLASLSKPVEKLGLGVFPLAAMVLLCLQFSHADPVTVKIDNWQMAAHIITSIIAFSLLNIAALQAILLLIQEKQLRKHPPSLFIQTLPSLQTMESLLFQMIAIGLLFLTVSLLSGFVFIEDLLAQHLAHKTVLGMIAWVIFSALLVGKIRYGWRGKMAVKWTLAGFVLLLLAYFGSKLVLEVILERSLG